MTESSHAGLKAARAAVDDEDVEMPTPRTLAIAAAIVVPLAGFGWHLRSERLHIEQRASAAASQVAGRSVKVHCPGQLRRRFIKEIHDGEVQFVDGRPGGRDARHRARLRRDRAAARPGRRARPRLPAARRLLEGRHRRRLRRRGAHARVGAHARRDGRGCDRMPGGQPVRRGRAGARRLTAGGRLHRGLAVLGRRRSASRAVPDDGGLPPARRRLTRSRSPGTANARQTGREGGFACVLAGGRRVRSGKDRRRTSISVDRGFAAAPATPSTSARASCQARKRPGSHSGSSPPLAPRLRMKSRSERRLR